MLGLSAQMVPCGHQLPSQLRKWREESPPRGASQSHPTDCPDFVLELPLTQLPSLPGSAFLCTLRTPLGDPELCWGRRETPAQKSCLLV